MAIDITPIQDYVERLDGIVTTILDEETVFEKFRFREYPFVHPGKYEVRIFTPNVTLSDCCTEPVSGGSITTKEVEADCILAGDSYCEVDLLSILKDANSRYTAGREDAGSIEEIVVNGNLADFKDKWETLGFLGDTTSLDPNLNKLNGYVTLATNSADTIKPTITATDLWGAIVQIVRSVPRDARNMGRIGIFMSEELVESLTLSYAMSDLSHLVPRDYKQGAELGLFGYALSDIVIVPVKALNGTNTIIATPFENMVYLYNRENDINTIEWDYNSYHQRYFWRIKTIFGVEFVIDSYVVIATLSDEVANNIQRVYNVNITSPLNDAGNALAVDQTT